MGNLELIKETMSSIEIAELTGKEHKNVMRDIRTLLEQGVQELNFEPSFIIRDLPNGGSKQDPCFNLTKKGCLILASGYDAKLREKIISRWEELEIEKRNGGFKVPSSFSEALRLAAIQMEQIEQQQKQLEADKPKVLFAEAVSTSQRSCLISELAKIISQNGVSIGQNRLFAWMRKNGYLCNKGQYYNQPTQKAMELGLFEIKKTTITKPSGDVIVNTTSKVTGKGQIYFVNKFIGKEEPDVNQL
mgnify:FL=1